MQREENSFGGHHKNVVVFHRVNRLISHYNEFWRNRTDLQCRGDEESLTDCPGMITLKPLQWFGGIVAHNGDLKTT